MPEIPSVLIETAYISNPTEEKLLRTPAFQEEIAGVIAGAIVKFVPCGQAPVVVHAGAVEKTAPAAAKKDAKAEKPRQREGRAIEKGREDEAAPAPKKAVAKAEPAEERKPSAADPARAKKNGTISYKVKKGDTLEKIAARHDTTVADLLKLNDMKLKDPLWVDRKLKVPAAEKEKGREAPAEKKAAAKTKKKPSTYVVKKGDTLEKIASKHSTSIAALMKVNKIKLNEPLYVNRKLIIPAEEDI
jgi:N-acetylmuramoyl-L-alanine amidase